MKQQESSVSVCQKTVKTRNRWGKMPSSSLQRYISLPFFLVTVFLNVQEKKPLEGKIAELCSSGLDSMSHSKWQYPLSVHMLKFACDPFLLSYPKCSVTQRFIALLFSSPWHTTTWPTFQMFLGQGGKKRDVYAAV